MQTSELPDNSTGPPACVHTGLRAMKLVSSIRVTKTEVVIPFLGNVAAAVAPIARVDVVRFLPATVSAFASAGGVGAVADVDGDGEALGVGVEVAVGVAVGVAVALGDAVGDALATGFAGAFFTGAFFTGFFTTFLAGGFLAASARSPITMAEITPANIERNLRRPDRFDGCEGFSIIIRSIPFDYSARTYGYTVGSRQLHHKWSRGG